MMRRVVAIVAIVSGLCVAVEAKDGSTYYKTGIELNGHAWLELFQGPERLA
ncbi:MAG TPA: hypothetical protein VFB14_25035 [Bryobacteraceae bacterium]|jgi:hypothetical protein|nr:hypothetical protein [Bryobacteraceae bacterium]